MPDAGALFIGGFNAGVAAKRNREFRKQQEFENQLRTRDADLEYAIRSKKKEEMEKEWALKQEALRSDAARYVEAEKALELFNGATSLIDFGKPDAAKQYQTVTLQYLPTILKHDSTSKKWEAFDRQVKQGQAFTVEKAREAGVVGAYRQAVELGIVDFPRTQSGDLDTEALQTKIDEAYERQLERGQLLRRSAIDARMEAEASGAYGGRTATKPTLGPGSKAEMETVADELRAVNKALGEPITNPDRKLELVNRKSSLQRRLRSFDSMATPPPIPAPAPVSPARIPDPDMFKGNGPSAPSAPGAEGASRTIKVGDTVWTITQPQ